MSTWNLHHLFNEHTKFQLMRINLSGGLQLQPTSRYFVNKNSSSLFSYAWFCIIFFVLFLCQNLCTVQYSLCLPSIPLWPLVLQVLSILSSLVITTAVLRIIITTLQLPPFSPVPEQQIFILFTIKITKINITSTVILLTLSAAPLPTLPKAKTLPPPDWTG